MLHINISNACFVGYKKVYPNPFLLHIINGALTRMLCIAASLKCSNIMLLAFEFYFILLNSV